MDNKEYGALGEKYAEAYLIKNGYRILAKNYVIHKGELDLVAFRRGVISIIEVKSRSSDTFGSPRDAVGEDKQAILKKTGERFLRKNTNEGRVPVYNKLLRTMIWKKFKSAEYDIVEVFMNRSGGLVNINHIKKAF